MPAEYASRRFQIVGEDIQGALLRTSPGAAMTGRITLDEPGAGLEPRSVRLEVAAIAINERPMSTGIATVGDDWSFEIRDVMATGALQVKEPTGQWWIKNVSVDGRDVSDMPLDFRPGAFSSDVQLLLTRRAAQLSGIVDSRAPGVAIVVFPSESTLWTPTTRRIAVASPDQAGHFVIGGLPTGAYQVIAIDGFQRGAERHVATLRTLVGRSDAIQLREGELKTVNLEVVER